MFVDYPYCGSCLQTPEFQSQGRMAKPSFGPSVAVDCAWKMSTAALHLLIFTAWTVPQQRPLLPRLAKPVSLIQLYTILLPACLSVWNNPPSCPAGYTRLLCSVIERECLASWNCGFSSRECRPPDPSLSACLSVFSSSFPHFPRQVCPWICVGHSSCLVQFFCKQLWCDLK